MIDNQIKDRKYNDLLTFLDLTSVSVVDIRIKVYFSKFVTAT